MVCVELAEMGGVVGLLRMFGAKDLNFAGRRVLDCDKSCQFRVSCYVIPAFAGDVGDYGNRYVNHYHL